MAFAFEFRLPRRRFLAVAAGALALRRLGAQQEPAAYGVTALLDGSGMVRIPAGEFQMGSAGGEADEAPVHRVRISHDFEIGKFEVSQAQWETVMLDPHAKAGAVRTTPEGVTVGANPSHFKGASLPVESVSWDDIQVFLARLGARDREHTYRLPTEAEWEYACKDDAAELGARAWFKDNAGDQTQPVGGKQPNARGLFDTLGNVAEWVQDWYGHDYYGESLAADPQGPGTGSYRVFRGGSWLDPGKYCRVTARNFEFPVSRLHNVGFRIVRTTAPADNSAIVGLWSGKLEGLTSIRMTIEEDDGKLAGAALFYLMRRDPGAAPTASPGFPTPMISPSFDGKTLTFKISHRHAHPPRTLNDPPVSFRLELTGPDKAMCYGPEGAAAEIVREMQ